MVNSRCVRLVSLTTVFAVSVVVACACSAVRMEEAAGMEELPRLTGDTKVPLDSSVRIASSRMNPSTIAATLAFQLAEIPNPAKLEMLVTGIDSACPLPNLPQGSTDLLVNGHRVTSFTLGPSGIGHIYRVMADLEPSMLKRGDNTLVLKGLPCTLGNFEVVKISDVVVRSVR